MAPNLNMEQRKQYVAVEKEFVEELLEDTDDCKWVYQTLIELALLDQKLGGSRTDSKHIETKQWLEKLMQLDPLRTGRWQDLKASLDIASVR